MGFGEWLAGAVGSVVDSIAAVINFLKWAWKRIDEHLGVVICGLLAGIAYIWAKLWELIGAGSAMVQQMSEQAASPDGPMQTVVTGWIGGVRFVHYVFDVEIFLFGLGAMVTWTFGLILYRVIKSYLPTASSS